MPLTFAADEIVSTSHFQKSGKTVMNNLKKGEKKKYGLMRNGKIEAVIIPLKTAEKYNREYLANLYEVYNHDMEAVLEHMEIEEIIENKSSETLNWEEMEKELAH